MSKTRARKPGLPANQRQCYQQSIRLGALERQMLADIVQEITEREIDPPSAAEVIRRCISYYWRAVNQKRLTARNS